MRTVEGEARELCSAIQDLHEAASHGLYDGVRAGIQYIRDQVEARHDIAYLSKGPKDPAVVALAEVLALCDESLRLVGGGQ